MTGGEAPYRKTVRFVLDGDIVELSDVDPNRTVLQYLRDDLRRTGTKEGCAEGDCGACTVAVVDLDPCDDRLRTRAINSCIQFLPTLDGKELLTVESLAGNELHPVQQAMVDHHGSQCGFCTPGFVMSLFALYKNESNPTRREIDDALAGNLCRCTGYQPIITAAKEMYGLSRASQDWTHSAAGDDQHADEQRRMDALRSLQSDQGLCVESSARKFFAPNSIAQLAELVEQHPEATILAGGTDVGLWVTKQHRELDTIIYTGGVSDACNIVETETQIDIGAAVSLSDAMPVIVAHYPDLEELFLRFGSPPIRNAGTLGGNVANGSPIGDSMPALLVVDTELVLRKGKVTRKLPLSEFFVAYQQTALQAGEFIERILIPLPHADDAVRSYKVSKRFDQDISAVCGAYRVRMSGEEIAEVRIAYGGMAAMPERATRTEQALAGGRLNEQSLDKAMRLLQDDFTPISDMRSSSFYRQRICGNLLKRFFHDITGQGSESVYGYGRR